MKIKFCSDLHLERATYVINNDDNSDVLILAGDICQASDLCNNSGNIKIRLIEFFKRCSDQFKHVVYVVGNHEHYSYDFDNTIVDIKNELAKYPNIYVLENECLEIGGYVIIGSTLWADLNNADTVTMMTIPIYMNDFRIISKGNHVLKPTDSLKLHNISKQYILDSIQDKSKQYIVVTHHLPSFNSLNEKFKQYKIVNGAYFSELSPLIQDNPHIKLWISGHTHLRHSYYINKTLFACNPRGYKGYEECADSFTPVSFQLDALPNSQEIRENTYWSFFPIDI